MRNLILILSEVLVCYIAIIILNKKYKTDGLYVYAVIATFMSCIMSLKQITIIDRIDLPIGFGVTTSLIIAGNIITQKRGPKEITTYIVLILVTALVSCCFLNMSGIMIPSDYNKYANKSYDSIFEYNLRIYLAAIISIIISTWLSSKLYYELKKVNNNIMISNIFSVVIAELAENLLFVLIAYLFEPGKSDIVFDIIFCIIFRYIIKTIIGLFGTIPIYITNKFNWLGVWKYENKKERINKW